MVQARIQTVSYSEISTFRDCPLKWRLSYMEGFREPEVKVNLRLGSAWHALLEGHYSAFVDTEPSKRDLKTARAAAGAQLQHWLATNRDGGVTPDEIDTLRWMYEAYCEKYDVDPEWDILKLEETRIVPMMKIRGVQYVFKSRIDMLIRNRFNQKLLIVDNKSAGKRDLSKEAFANERALDDQFGLYTASYALFGPVAGRLAIFGSIYNGARTDKLQRDMTLEERHGRHVMFHNPTELANLWEEASGVVRAIAKNRDGIKDAPMWSSPNPGECKWKCQYMEAHLASRQTGKDIRVTARSYGLTSREDRFRRDAELLARLAADPDLPEETADVAPTKELVP